MPCQSRLHASATLLPAPAVLSRLEPTAYRGSRHLQSTETDPAKQASATTYFKMYIMLPAAPASVRNDPNKAQVKAVMSIWVKQCMCQSHPTSQFDMYHFCACCPSPQRNTKLGSPHNTHFTPFLVGGSTRLNRWRRCSRQFH